MKQLLSIILLLAAIIPDSILAMERPGSPLYPVISPSSSSSSSSSSGIFPEYPAPAFDYQDAHVGSSFEELPQPVRIKRHSNPLRPETSAYVERCSIGSATVTAGLSVCGIYLCVQNSDLPFWWKLRFTVAGSALSGIASYVAAKRFVTSRTAEKKDEALFNERVDLNNAAFAAKCNLSANERSNLNLLIQQDQCNPKNREVVYHCALSLHQPKKAREYPIRDAVKYLDGAADAIKYESEALGKMKRERPSSDNRTISNDKWDEMLKDVNQTYQAIRSLNDILPAQGIKNWTSTVKQLPEYKYQTAQEALREKHKDLKKREADIKYYLARLAALHGHTFSQACLSKSFAQHPWASISTNYSDTPEGRRARAIDIEQSKNSISSLMQNYQTRALDYSNAVIPHNETIAKVPETIKVFVQSRGGNIDLLAGYELNKKLLQYNDYLNHNNGDVLLTWIKSFFSDN